MAGYDRIRCRNNAGYVKLHGGEILLRSTICCIRGNSPSISPPLSPASHKNLLILGSPRGVMRAFSLIELVTGVQRLCMGIDEQRQSLLTTNDRGPVSRLMPRNSIVRECLVHMDKKKKIRRTAISPSKALVAAQIYIPFNRGYHSRACNTHT